MSQRKNNRSGQPGGKKPTPRADQPTANKPRAGRSKGPGRPRSRAPREFVDHQAELYDIVGDAEPIEKDFHQRWPGLTMRAKRRKEWLYLKALELRRHDRG